MWPFKKKTTEQEFVELMDSIGDGTSGQVLTANSNGQVGWSGQNSLANQQSIPSGAGSLAAQGQSSSGGAGGLSNLTHSQLHTMIQTLIVGVTKEEQAELDQLKKEYEVKLKQHKLDMFKALCSEMRQQVINRYEWRACHQNMNNAVIEKDPRLMALENKDNMGKIYMQNGTSVTKAAWYDDDSTNIIGNLPLPKGLTLEDLKQAHMEASLEEEMLSSEPNS